MTTETSSRPTSTSATSALASSPAKVIFQGQINVDLIDVKEQVRKKFDETEHKNLTESVRTKGVINPVTLRPGKKAGRFELVAGERRFRAAKAAGLVSILAVVRELDDQAAALYQVEENIHRKDLTPVEEAHGFKALLDAKKFTVEQLAGLVKKDKSHVYRRLALLELPDKVLDMIEAGQLTPEHGHQVLRVPADRRGEVIAYISKAAKQEGRYITAKELQRAVDEQLGADLKNAPWKKDVPFAGKPACSTCPSNSGNQGALFDGAVTGRCMNLPCFQAKGDQVEKDNAKELVAKYPGVRVVAKDEDYRIESKYGVVDLERVLSNTKVQKAIKENPEAFVMAMVKEMDWEGNKRVETIRPAVFVKKASQDLILKAIGAGHSEAFRFGHRSSSSGGGETAQQRFMRQTTEKNILDAVAKSAAKVEKKHWIAIVVQLYNANVPKHTLQTAGVDFSGSSGYGGYDSKLTKLLEALPLEKIQTMAVQIAVWPHTRGQYHGGWNEARLRAIGLDAGKVVKKAKADAAAAWKTKKEKKA